MEMIPPGLYCYWIKEGGDIPCKYWSIDTNHEYQDNGYCSYLGLGDWDSPGLSLLWDQCKECGENMEEEDDEEFGNS